MWTNSLQLTVDGHAQQLSLPLFQISRAIIKQLFVFYIPLIIYDVLSDLTKAFSCQVKMTDDACMHAIP